jgi:imidazolonepropionase-like amidohydrolase
MRALRRTAVAVLATLLALVTASAPAASQDLLIRGGWLFDGTGDEVIRNHGILLSNGRILEVGTHRCCEDLPGVEVLRLGDDDYVLPGIIDLHAHYNVDLLGQRRVDEVEVNPLVYLANGVTSTFPAGEYNPERLLRARREIDRGERPGPRIFTSGPYYGSARTGWSREAMTPDSIAAEVAAWADSGAVGFKAKGADDSTLRALIRAAHRHGRTVTGHLDSGFRGSVNSADAIRMGIDRVEHILGGPALDPERPAYPVWVTVDTASAEFREIVDLFLGHRVHFNATITAPVYFTELKEGFDHWVDEVEFFTPYVQRLVAERPPRDRNELMSELYWTMRRTTKAFFDAGGGDLITLGTDAASRGDFLPGFGAHRELHAFVLAGIPEAAALRMATINGARAIGMGDRLGTIEPGKLADLFVVRGNPLEDITRTRGVRHVVKDGRVYDPAELLEAGRGRIGPRGPEEAADW